jgi:predicted branched-subunit amino acid permease
VAIGLVASPTISGLFFCLVAALLVLQRGSFERAAEVGALVGGVMFASTAVALCVVLRRGRSESTALHT